jgi:hypothetical protein
MSPHFDDVAAHLRAHPDTKWGFVVYRCTYGDDPAWDRMMNRLNTQALSNLTSCNAADLFPAIDWAVQENPAWDNARAALIKQ